MFECCINNTLASCPEQTSLDARKSGTYAAAANNHMSSTLT
jgi:hypothetical protein